MTQPLLLELNTRCWLRALSDRLGRIVTLAAAPDEELALWKERGLTHVWLMGVWATGPKGRDLARAQPNLRALSTEAFGPEGEAMLVSSPFAVADFFVAEPSGGAAALRKFRAKLKKHGLKLVLDFIPNHLGVDHAWLTQRTGLFVQSAEQRPETFPVQHPGGTSWVAHGKDPYFPAWTDTAQLDYRKAETRTAMIEALQSIASQCDGVRCDMAMLVLNDIFDRTWGHISSNAPRPPGEFWADAIAAVKQSQPQFTFIAEAYWDLEERLQSLGFDYLYDKKFLDDLKYRNYPALQECIRAGKFRPVRFLENHDEARIASALTVPEQKAAAALLLAQPGMRLLNDGQWSGKRRHTPVQFARYWPEPDEPEIAAFYGRLLPLLRHTAIGNGEMEFCETRLPHCFAMKWKNEGGRLDLVAVNLAPQRAAFQIRDVEASTQFSVIYSEGDSTWNLQGGGLHVDLAPCGFQLLQKSDHGFH